VKISHVHVKILPEHLELMRVNVEPVYIGTLMEETETENSAKYGGPRCYGV
jgi:hypothetical protein